MDNLQTHHSNAVKEVFRKFKHKSTLFTTYSFDLNPIEKNVV